MGSAPDPPPALALVSVLVAGPALQLPVVWSWPRLAQMSKASSRAPA